MSSQSHDGSRIADFYGDHAIVDDGRRSAWVEGGTLNSGGDTSSSDVTYTVSNWSTACCGNCTCSTQGPIPEYSDIISHQGVRVTIFVLYLVAIVAAVVGNTCVISIIYNKKNLRRNPTILLILNLALCDLASCLIYRPLFLVELFLPFRKEVPTSYDHLDQCRITVYFQSLFGGVVFHTMVAISQERLLLIVRPLQAKALCSAKRTKRILLLIWFLTACIILPAPILFTEMLVVSIDGTVVSFCGYFSGGHGAVIFFSFIFAIYYAIPAIVMTVSYSKIFSALYRRSGALTEVNEDSGAARSMRTRRSLARMMLSISIIFALCWGPNFFYLLYVSTGGTVAKNGFFIATVVKFIPIVSSALNPFVYTINSRTFRNGFRSMLLRRKSLDESSFGIGGRTTTATTSLRRKSSSNSVKRQSSLGRASKQRSVAGASVYYYKPAASVQRTSTLSTKVADCDEAEVLTPLQERDEATGSPRDSGLGPEEISGAGESGTFPGSKSKKRNKSSTASFAEVSV